jgi:hypothetical protein
MNILEDQFAHINTFNVCITFRTSQTNLYKIKCKIHKHIGSTARIRMKVIINAGRTLAAYQ